MQSLWAFVCKPRVGFPQDYSQSFLHYHDGALKRGSHSPAFQVIFIYDTVQGALDIYLDGSKDTVTALQEIFAKQILGISQLFPDRKKCYQLDALKQDNFRFNIRPEWGIECIDITSLGVTRFENDSARQHIFRCTTQRDLYNELGLYHPVKQRDFQDVRPLRKTLSAFSATVKVQYKPLAGKKRVPQRTFIITPNSCNLKYDGRDLMLRQMLYDSGLEEYDTATAYSQSPVAAFA